MKCLRKSLKRETQIMGLKMGFCKLKNFNHVAPISLEKQLTMCFSKGNRKCLSMGSICM